jgi:hypothetical protein
MVRRGKPAHGRWPSARGSASRLRVFPGSAFLKPFERVYAPLTAGLLSPISADARISEGFRMPAALGSAAAGTGGRRPSVRSEHTEDLGGVVVKVLNAVQVLRCRDCHSEMVAIPDMGGLARAAVISRALSPVRLSGREIKFFRRVLDMHQAEFAKTMDLTSETISRLAAPSPFELSPVGA